MSKKEILFDVVNKLRTILSMEPLKEDFVEDTKLEDVETEDVVETEEIKLGEAVLEDGVIIYFEGEALEIGTEVFIKGEDDVNVVIADGDYVLEDGIKFTITDGLVSEIITDEIPVEDEVIEEVVEDLEDEKLKELKDLISELNEKIEKFEKNETLLKAEIDKLGSESEVEPLHATPQEKRELTNVEKKLNAMEAWNKKYGNI